MDHRDVQANTSSWYKSFDEKNMKVIIEELETEDDEFLEDVSVHVKFDVCPTCNGKGSHVNPSIDAHGITADEWDRDWSYEDKENYMSGFYDVQCYECHGKRVVPIPSEHNDADLLKAINEAQDAKVQAAYDMAMEQRMGY